jgi:hypothetical protein
VISRLVRRLKAVFRGGALDGQLDAELQFHIDLEAARFERQGMSPDQARTTALRGLAASSASARNAATRGRRHGPKPSLVMHATLFDSFAASLGTRLP